jgi:hypothetical protein
MRRRVGGRFAVKRVRPEERAAPIENAASSYGLVVVFFSVVDFSVVPPPSVVVFSVVLEDEEFSAGGLAAAEGAPPGTTSVVFSVVVVSLSVPWHPMKPPKITVRPINIAALRKFFFILKSPFKLSLDPS